MIYLDHNATTPMNNEAKQMMIELLGKPLNPSSIHSFGRQGKSALETARMQIALILGIRERVDQYKITFTSSGTEANNLLLQNYNDGEIFISATEHSSIMMFGKAHDNVKIIDVDANGIINLDDLEQKLANSSAKKKLISVMLANNETGIIQPIKEVSLISKQFGAELHSDIIQAVGKIPVNLLELDVDFASISGHKFGGPTGVGALIARANYHLMPMIFGGGQEKSLRAGTENVASIAGMGKAAEIAAKELSLRAKTMLETRNYLESLLLKDFPQVKIIGKNENRLPNTSFIINTGKIAETQVIAFDLQDIAISSGSACSSGKVGKSSSLEAMGYNAQDRESALRISVSSDTTKQEINDFIKIFAELNN